MSALASAWTYAALESDTAALRATIRSAILPSLLVVVGIDLVYRVPAMISSAMLEARELQNVGCT
jgi:hypothetical protein